MQYLENPVFICGHRKTGTTMMINLLDGNREFVTYPDDSGYFYLYYPRFATDAYTDEEKIERLCQAILTDNIATVFDKIQCSKEERAELDAKATHCRQLVRKTKMNNIGGGDMLRLFIESFRQSFYPDISAPKGWIEKTTSTEIYALDMLEEFPQAKFVHIIRDPRDNWASLSSGWEKRYQHFNDEINRLKQSMIERGRLGMEMAVANSQAIGPKQYKIVRFEDLVTDPQTVMKEITAFIGLTYSDDILRTSTLRHTWDGNNFDGLKFTKPSAVNVSRWKERISEEDAMLMEFHFRDMMETFEYAPVFSAKETAKAASDHYKWFNFSTPFSAK